MAAAAGFGGLVYGLTQFGEGRAGRSVLFIMGGLAAIAIFVARQLRLQRGGSPLMDLRTLLHATYAKALALMSLAFMGMLSSMILLPLYLQNLRGLSPLQTGLLVMPGGFAMGLLGPTVGRLFDRFGGRVLVIPSSFGVLAALAGFTQVSMTMPYWQILGLHILLMLSLAALFTPVFTLGLGALPPHLYSHGSSMLGTLQQVAAAFGTALAVTAMTVQADHLTTSGVATDLAQLGGMRLGFLVGAVVSTVVVVLALRMPQRAEQNHDATPHTLQDAQYDELAEELEAAG